MAHEHTGYTHIFSCALYVQRVTRIANKNDWLQTRIGAPHLALQIKNKTFSCLFRKTITATAVHARQVLSSLEQGLVGNRSMN